MNGLARLLPYVAPHRRQLMLSSFFAVLVALFWGLNLSIALPIMKVLVSDQNLQEYVSQQIREKDVQSRDLFQRLQRLDAELAEITAKNSNFRPNLSQLSEKTSLQSKLTSASRQLVLYRWLEARILPWVPRDQFDTFAVILLFILVATIIKGGCIFAQELIVGRVVQLITMAVRKDCLRRILRLDYQTISKSGTSELLALVTHEVDVMANGLLIIGGKVIREPLKALSCILFAFWINWQLTTLSLVFVPLALFVFHRMGQSLKKASHRSMESMSRIYKVLEETLDGVKVVLAFNGAPRHRQRFHKENKNYFRKSMSIVTVDALTNPVIEVLGIFALLIAMCPGAYLVLRHTNQIWGITLSSGPMTIEELFALYALLAGILDPVRKLSSVYAKLKKASAAADRVFHLMEIQSLVKDPVIPVELPRHETSIEFKDLSFAYLGSLESGRGPALEQVSLKVRVGEVIAVVGDNGSGKSTLVNLLPRYYDPDRGSVLVDGIDIKHCRIRDLRSQLGVVTQETILFDDTIYENIRYGRPEASRVEIEQAAKQAHVLQFLDQFPERFETRVGERGMRLSGGQRQRVALARAILRNPAILILDEATSAIDTQSEYLIHKTLAQFVKDRTTFIITHSVTQSVLELVSRIAVMDQGRLVAVGTHEELLKTCVVYQKLHQLQVRQKSA